MTAQSHGYVYSPSVPIAYRDEHHRLVFARCLTMPLVEEHRTGLTNLVAVLDETAERLGSGLEWHTVVVEHLAASGTLGPESAT